MQKVFSFGLLLLTCCFSGVIGQDKAVATNETKSAGAPAPAATAASGEANIRFQFDGIPYMDVVERFAQMADKPLIAETNVQGTVTFNDPRPYTYPEALETLNTILSMKNVMLVETERYLQLVPFKDLPQMPLKIFRGLDKTGDVRAGEIVTVVLELKNLEAAETAKATSSMLSSAGSVAPLTRGKGLIITDRLENIRRIKQLLAEIDTSSPVQRQMKTYTLVHASGAVVADLINKTFGASTAPKRTIWNESKKAFDTLPPDPEDYVTAVYDDASRTLLLFGPGERVQMAEELIHKFEDKEGGRGGEVKIFYPRATKAEELARMIRQAIPGVAAENENASTAATKARVIVDKEMNRIIVAAPIAGQLDSIENLIDRVERSTGDGGAVTDTRSETVQITKVIRLQVADAPTAFRVLTNAFTRRNTYGEPVLGLKANLDPQTKTIVVTGSPGDIQHAMGIIEQMENISPAAGPQETVFLDFATAAEMKRVQPLLQQLYVSQVSDGTLGTIATAKFLPDPESKRLIVSASKEHIKIIQQIADQLKSPAIATQPREFRALTLKNVKVDQAFKSISDLVAERMNDDIFRDVTKPLLLPDATNNRLLITANAAQLKEIDQIVQAVDLAPKKTDRQIANVSLQSQNAAQILPSLTQLMKPLVDAHPDASSRPEVIVDASGKSLIVSAAPEDIEKIREMIRQIEGTKTDGAARQFKAVKLYNRTPTEVATLAEQLYREQLKGQPDPAGGPASFVPETKGNRVIVIGSEPEVARGENIIRQIDPTMARTAKDETRVIRLRNGQAQDLAALVEKSLNLDEEKVKLLIDVRSNSLVVSGSAAGVDSAAQMIEQLDVLPNTQPKEVRMIELKSADARTVVPLLQDLLGDVMRNVRGSNYVLQSRLVADTNANRVIVTGTADELQQISGLVQRLDSAPQQTEGTRVFQLHSANATEMAKVVSDSMITYGPGNQQIKRVTVAPDEKSNSLVVTGSRTDLQDVQVIIEKLDGGEPRGGREVKVIELQTDEPSKLVTVAQQVWTAQSQGRPGLNDISFTLDPSGKRVIVVGPSNLMPQVEQVITSLDQKPDGPARTLQTVELKKRPASAIMTVLTRLYEEQEKGKKTKAATIVPESSGKRLLVYGSEEQAATIKGIVEKLEGDADGSERETKMIEVGQAEDAARLLPLVQQLYQEQMKGSADTADAQILADEQGGRLIVTARSAQLPKIEEIISKLQSGKPESRQHETRIYNLSSSTATELAQTVNSLYQEEIKKNSSLSNSKALILPDSIANRLIVSGLSNQVASIEQIIKQLDQVSPQTGGTRLFKLKSASAEQVASVLSTALVEHDRNNLRSVPRVSVGADTNSNSLVVSGEAKDLNAAATIIEQLDSSTEHKEREMRILALKSGRAAELANRVRALYLDQVKNNPKIGPADALIMGDSTSDRLIITASEAQLEAIQKIVSQLDELNSGENRQLAVRPLKKTSAISMSALIQQFFARNISSRDPQLRLIVTPSPDDRSLILEGSEETLSKVDELAQTLDNRPEEQNVQVRSYQVAEARASDLAPTLARIFAERNPGEPAQQPRFEADASSNLLLVAATADQFEVINKLIEEVKATAQVANEIRTFKLVHSDAEQLVPVLSSMLKAEDPNIPPWRRQQFRTSNDPKTVNVAAAPAVNAIVVQGPPAALKSAEQIIQSLDNGEATGKSIIQTVHLKKGTAEMIAEAVNKALAARAPKSNLQRASVTAVSSSNSLLIDGPAESVQDVVKIIQELDQESSGGDVEIRVYKLEHGKAREISSLINQMLQSVLRENARVRRGGSNAGGGRRSSVAVTPDERTNSLIVSANPEEFKTIEQLLLTLDQNSAKTDRSVRFVLLKNARATSVSNRLNLMFENRSKDERPVIESDTFANTVTIIGSKADIAEAESVISELDQVPKEESLQVRMLVVENLPASQMAKMLKSLYSQMSNTEIQLVDKLTPQNRGATNQPPTAADQQTNTNKAVVTISVDPTANALLLSGPSNELDAINRLVDELTWSTLGNDAEFRQFALKEADPVAVAKTLSELFKPEPIRVQPRQGGEPQVVQPAARMTIVAEPRTRSIIVRAKATDFILLESLLQQLDQKSPTAQLAFRLVPLLHAEPAKILPLVNEMIKQLGVTRPGEAVSVVADSRTHSMFIVGRESMLADAESMIKSLDTAPAFAEAEVALIPLKNTVAAQVATILQNMLKPGQAGETTPEARELQEQIRSLRIKDDDAKEILLDLTKPIKIMADSAPGAKGANRLIVSSTPDNLKALRAVIEMMDSVAVVEGVTFKIIRLQNADAQSVAQTLQQIFEQGKTLAVGPAGPAQPDSETGKALAGPLTIATDRRSNSLIVSGKPESINLVQRLLRDLDEEFKGFVTTVRLFHLNYASAVRLAPLLQTVFTEASPMPGTEGLANQVTRLQTLMNTNEVAAAKTTQQPKTRAALTIQADDPSNTLIVAARADMLPLIEDVIRSMDIPAATGMEMVRIYPLKNADATRLQKVITEIYTARGNQLRPEEKPGLSVDNRTNALIVSGNERIFAFIETIILQLDKDLPFEYGEFRVIKLENADASVIAQHLQQILDARAQQKAVLSAQPAQALRAIVIGDPRINALIVGGATEVFELVQALAKQLDVPGIALSGQIRLVPLKNANAGTISSALNSLFNQRYSTARSADVQRNRPVIIPDPRINALLVSAGIEDNKALDELLQKLDQKIEDPALSLTVIGLKHNDAGRVGDMIQTVFAGRLQAMTLPGSSPNPQDRVVVSEDALSNALIVLANKENLQTIQDLIQKIDKEPEVEGGVFQIITLKNADAGRVASMLRGLISQGLYRPGMLSARGQGQSARGRDGMAIAVDTRSNTLIVSASPENLAIIKEVVNQIDSKEYALEGDIKLYSLKHARASQLAQSLQQFFQAKRSGEQQGRENERTLPVTIIGDDRTNTILVTGGKEAFDAVDRMLLQLDSEDVADKMNFRVFPLKNSTATKLQGTLTRLFLNRPIRITGKANDPITVVADSWANALIVGAAVDDMSMVASLIETLDNTQPENMQVQVIPVVKGDARSISQTIISLYRDTPGAPPSIRVDVDERINALVVSAGEADLKRINELVQKLDAAQVARVSEIRIFPLKYAQAEELAPVLTTAFTGRPIDGSTGTSATTSPARQSMLQFITRTPEGEELVASALKESLLITADRRRNALVISAPVDSMNLLGRIINSLDSESPQVAKIRVFRLQNADARQMADVLTSLFRLRQQPGVPANQRAIQYTLVRDVLPGDIATGEPVTATIGSAEQYALTVTIDFRTNSLLLGGTDHYVGLASHIIEELDSTPAQEHKTEVYRLKNSLATNVVVALTGFIDQERKRIMAVAEQSDMSTNAISSVVGNLQQQFEREVAIVAEPISNTLLLSASPRYFERFKALIEELDQPMSQVLIQVILAEVTLDKTSELGVEWAVQGTKNGTKIQTGTDFGVANQLKQFGGFSSAITGGDVSFLMRALESDGRLEVLSRPQILTADNQKATIDIGDRVPLVTDSRVTAQGDTINSFKYENVGVSLTVTPRISPDGFVKMEIEPIISQITSTSVAVSPGINSPVISQRKATTTVSVQNGQSVIIGGLIATSDDSRRAKVPFLGNIPYLGALFRSSKMVSNRKELLIILTPQLLAGGDTLAQVDSARRLTEDQLQRTTIKDEIRRDKLQQEILNPLLPLMQKPDGSTNSVAPKT